ncbi:MAG: RNA polymerase sigma-54 factor, partial [Methyloceanibacter sp.]
MAINAKLELRQTQSLVMTPQLQQAIKLLQLSNMELSTFVEGELERNPLLERAEGDDLVSPPADGSAAEKPLDENSSAADADDTDSFVDLESGGDNSRTDDLDADPRDMFPDLGDFVPGAVLDSGWS